MDDSRVPEKALLAALVLIGLITALVWMRGMA